MKSKYNISQKVIVFTNGVFEKCVVQQPFVDHCRSMYFVENENGRVAVDEDDVYTVEELESLHDELENLILMEKSASLEKIFKNCNIYSKLFQIENFLCDN